MKQTRKVFISSVFFCISAATQADQKLYSDVTSIEPYFEHGKVIMNTSMPNDGQSHYFTDNRGFEWGPTTLYRRDEQGLTQIRLEGMKIPADGHVTPDGQYFYFVDYGDNPSQVYRSEIHSDEYLKPERFEELNLPGGAGYITSTNTGTFYFVSDSDIYRYDGSEIARLPSEINSSQGEFDPFIAQDESFLIFVRQDKEGDSNMYISLRKENRWTTAEKLPEPFNVEKIDGSPYVTPDHKYLFFSSNRDGEVLKTWQARFAEYLESQMKK